MKPPSIYTATLVPLPDRAYNYEAIDRYINLAIKYRKIQEAHHMRINPDDRILEKLDDAWYAMTNEEQTFTEDYLHFFDFARSKKIFKEL